MVYIANGERRERSGEVGCPGRWAGAGPGFLPASPRPAPPGRGAAAGRSGRRSHRPAAPQQPVRARVGEGRGPRGPRAGPGVLVGLLTFYLFIFYCGSREGDLSLGCLCP